MRLSCAHCGSSDCVRNGADEVTTAYLDAGRVAYATSTVVRTKCRSCGRSGRVKDARLVAAEADLRDHVAERVFALGQDGAARETGIPSTTIQRQMQAWADMREPDVYEAQPDGLLLEPVRLRNADGYLVVDLDRRCLVEIVSGTSGLAAWLDAPSRPPALEACVPLDPATVSVLRDRVPSTRLLVAPSGVAKAVRSAASLALRAMRRRPDMAGRNGMPTVPEFWGALDGAPAHDGWPLEARALLTATLAALHVCASPSPEAAAGSWREFALAASGRHCRPVSGLMEAWREPLLAGIGRRDVEAVAGLAGRVRHGLVLRRPALGHSDLRAYALLREFERRPGTLALPGYAPMPVSAGTCLVGLAERLAA